MSFINPLFLYLLPLTAIPIIIHLIGRRRFQTIEFSSIWFLKELEHDVIRRMKLRQIILLILRTLLILLLILAFARPYRTNMSSGITVRRGETLYLIVDGSASMKKTVQGKNLLDYGKEDLNAAFSEVEFPILVKMVDATQPEIINDKGYIKNLSDITRLIADLQTKPFAGKIDQALGTVQKDLERHPEASVNVWVLSDFQKSSWITQQPNEHPLVPFVSRKGVRFILFPENRQDYNLSVSRVHIPDQILEIGKSVEIHSVVENWNEQSVEVPVSFFIEGERVGQSLASIPSLSRTDVVFEWTPLTTGYLSGNIQIEEDNLPTDNRRYFVVDVPQLLRVLLIYRTPEDADYLEKALKAKNNSLLDVNRVSEAILPLANLQDIDAIIFSGIDQLQENFVENLSSFLSDGKGIVVFPGRKNQPEVFNRCWAESFGMPKWKDMRKSSDGSYLKLGSIKTDHPIFREMWRQKKRPDSSPYFYTVPGFLIGKNHSVIMTYSDDTPLLIETQYGNGKILLFATSPVGGWTDLPLTGLFPPLIQRMTQYAAGKSARQTEYSCGDTLRFETMNEYNTQDITIITPSGRWIRPAIDRISNQIIFTQSDEPGIFTLESSGKLKFRFSVNVPETECRSEFLNASDLRDIAEMLPQRVVVYNSDRSDRSVKMNLNRECSGFLFFLVLVFAAVETFVGRINRINHLKDSNK